MNRQERRRQRAMLKRLAEREIDRLVEGFEDYEETGAPRKKIDDERAKQVLKRAMRMMVAAVEPEIVVRVRPGDAAAFPNVTQEQLDAPGTWFLAVGFDPGTHVTYTLRKIDEEKLAETTGMPPQHVMLALLGEHTSYAGFPT